MATQAASQVGREDHSILSIFVIMDIVFEPPSFAICDHDWRFDSHLNKHTLLFRPIPCEQSTTMIFKCFLIFGLVALSALSIAVEASISGEEDKMFLAARPSDDEEEKPISFPDPDEKRSLHGLVISGDQQDDTLLSTLPLDDKGNPIPFPNLGKRYSLCGLGIFGDKNKKIQMCHKEGGNPPKYHTITISENALGAHLAHGDTEGQCAGGGGEATAEFS